MVINHKIEQWAESHHPAWLDLVRMCLGIFLLIKGIVFISDISELQRLLITINLDWSSFWFAHYIAFAHLVGGVLIALGLLTRPAILFQLPILLGAVIFVHPSMDYNSINTEWWVSALTLGLLLLFLVFDSGPWSVDNYMRKHPET